MVYTMGEDEWRLPVPDFGPLFHHVLQCGQVFCHVERCSMPLYFTEVVGRR